MREVVAIAEPEQSENFFTLGPFRFTWLKFIELVFGGILLIGIRGVFTVPGLLLIILSLWPTKTVSIEKIIITSIAGFPKPKRTKRKEEQAKTKIIEVSRHAPLKLSGFAIDPATGIVLANAKVEVVVDNEVVATGISNEQGKYSIILTDLPKGLHELRVLVNGRVVKIFKIKVT